MNLLSPKKSQTQNTISYDKNHKKKSRSSDTKKSPKKNHLLWWSQITKKKPSLMIDDFVTKKITISYDRHKNKKPSLMINRFLNAIKHQNHKRKKTTVNTCHQKKTSLMMIKSRLTSTASIPRKINFCKGAHLKNYHRSIYFCCCDFFIYHKRWFFLISCL